jgi:hypothetical protein
MNTLVMVATIVSQLGLNVAGNALYDYLVERFKGRTEITGQELQAALGDYLVIHGVEADASNIMTVLADKGVISITAPHLYAPIELSMQAAPGASFFVGDQTTTRTDKSEIRAGAGAFMRGSNAAVVQEPDGSISFRTGQI